MTRHQIKQYVHAEFVCMLEHRCEVFVAAVARRDGVVVAYVVAGVVERRVEAGIDPDCIAAEIADVFEFADDASKIPDAVAVGVPKRLRIDFVENRVI